MKTKNLGIVVFLVALACMMGPASAATVNVDSSMSNTDIQNAITGATAGDTINFAPGTYNGISLTINKALNMVGNGATIIGNGSSVFTITGATGLTINGFNININSTTGGDGITGKNVYNCVIENNAITHGDDAINIFQSYRNLTIQNNNVSDMNNGRDGVSLVNHNATNIETSTSTRILNNNLASVGYGIFLGGNFQGTISGNTITGANCGMNITGKATATQGILNANITYNTIPGISMECPQIQSLTLSHNTINQLGNTGYSLLTNTNYGVNGVDNIYVTYNTFNYPVSQNFRDDAEATGDWSNNNI